MNSADPALTISQRIPSSFTNGPGERAVIWVQGCSLGCPGCFNPQTHPFASGERIHVSAIVDWLTGLPSHLEGLTISGGEPFQQSSTLSVLLEQVRQRTNLSIIVFSGFEMKEILKIKSASKAMENIDVLIAGRYLASQRKASGLIGSANKVTHFLTGRYGAQDFQSIPEAEIWIEPDGQILLSGIHPLSWQS
jgi:anaerobic ribonucleoside-triphosphate reductase activating protein